MCQPARRCWLTATRPKSRQTSMTCGSSMTARSKEWSEFSSRSRPRGFFEIMATQWYGTPDELLEAIEAAGIDYIALSDIWLDVFRGEGEGYAYRLALYESLEEAYPIAARFDRDDGRLGWPVTILAGPGRQSLRIPQAANHQLEHDFEDRSPPYFTA